MFVKASFFLTTHFKYLFSFFNKLVLCLQRTVIHIYYLRIFWHVQIRGRWKNKYFTMQILQKKSNSLLYRYRNNTLFLQLYKEQSLVFLWPCDVRWNVRVLRRFKVRTPPVAYRVFDQPVLLHAILSSQGLQQLTFIPTPTTNNSHLQTTKHKNYPIIY